MAKEEESAEEIVLPCMLEFEPSLDRDFYKEPPDDVDSESDSEEEKETLATGKTATKGKSKSAKNGKSAKTATNGKSAKRATNGKSAKPATNGVEENAVNGEEKSTKVEDKWHEVKKGRTKKKLNFTPHRKGINSNILNENSSPLDCIHELVSSTMFSAIHQLINEEAHKKAAENAEREDAVNGNDVNGNVNQASTSNGEKTESNPSTGSSTPTPDTQDYQGTGKCRTSSGLKNSYFDFNRYGEFNLTTWKDITLGELHKFMLVLISLSLVTIPHYSIIMERNFLLDGSWFHKIFEQRRFHHVLSFLHNAFDFNKSGGNKLRGLSTYIMGHSRKLYSPRRRLAVEEMVLRLPCNTGWAHRSYGQTTMEDKHVKILAVMENKTGFVLDMYVCFGGDDRCIVPNSLDDKLMIELLDHLLERFREGHHIYLDKGYTSLEVVKHLGKTFYFTGEIDVKTYDGIPEWLKAEDVAVGHSVWITNETEEILIAKYTNAGTRETRALISNKSKVKTVDVEGEDVKNVPYMYDQFLRVKQREKIHDTMQRFGAHHRPQKKWEHNFFNWLFEIAQWNAYVIYKTLTPKEKSHDGHLWAPTYLYFKGLASSELCRDAEKLIAKENGEIRRAGAPKRCLCYRYGFLDELTELKKMADLTLPV